MKNYFFKFILFSLSILFTYIFVFFYFFSTFEKDFKNNYKNTENFLIYKKYVNKINHLRYHDKYRFEKVGEQMIFNNIKDISDKKVILFQGDSWMVQINTYKSIHPMLNQSLPSFTKIINGGTASYSPSLINVQYNILEKDFKIKPNVLVIYIDQTDMGDEICRYKNLTKFDSSGNLISVSMEKFPLYKDVFNLHEKIVFSEIEMKKTSKFIKTQIYINYKIKKSYFRTKKRINNYFNKSQFKCEWKLIENYKVSINDKDKKYFKTTLEKLLLMLEKKEFIEKVFVVTHPHKFQLTTNLYPVNVSNFVSEVSKDFNKIHHINFTKILKENPNFYKDFETIWLKDNIHLDETNYKKFLNEIVKTVKNN